MKNVKATLGDIEGRSEFRRALNGHLGCSDMDVNQIPDFPERHS